MGHLRFWEFRKGKFASQFLFLSELLFCCLEFLRQDSVLVGYPEFEEFVLEYISSSDLEQEIVSVLVAEVFKTH